MPAVREYHRQTSRDVGGRTSTYVIWMNMRQRCLNPNHPHYKDYGGRGIAVCPQWDRFSQFLADMGERPLGMTLERENNDGPYSPDNCRWANRTEQANNRRGNRLLAMNGEVKTLNQWARQYRLHHATIQDRLDKYGWSVEEALTTPALTRRECGQRAQRSRRINQNVREQHS